MVSQPTEIIDPTFEMYNFLITKIQIFIDNTNRKEKGSGSKAENPFS